MTITATSATLQGTAAITFTVQDPIRRECEPALPATVIKRRVKPKTTLSGLESEAIVFGLPASVQNVRQPNGIRYS